MKGEADGDFWNVWEDLPLGEAEALYEAVFRELFDELFKVGIGGCQITPEMA